MKKSLVAYFSATGTTAAAAKQLAVAAGADLYEIKPAVPYTKEDLNWMNKKSRSSVEMNDKSSRTELADKSSAISSYDLILVGFPIWWYVAPTIINTFLESYDFTGKKIVLFATSGGSGLGDSAANMQKLAKGAKVVNGKRFSGSASAEELKAWAGQWA